MKTPQEWLDKINEERKKGNVCFMAIDTLASMPLSEFIQQPADGILYDLNRSPEVVATWIKNNPKWVNDYAVGDTITYLKTILDEKSTTIDNLVKEHVGMREEIDIARDALEKIVHHDNHIQGYLMMNFAREALIRMDEIRKGYLEDESKKQT